MLITTVYIDLQITKTGTPMFRMGKGKRVKYDLEVSSFSVDRKSDGGKGNS